MIRFSLTTLLLVAFWLAALMLVWTWREPWGPAAPPVLKELPNLHQTAGSPGKHLRAVFWEYFVQLVRTDGPRDQELQFLMLDANYTFNDMIPPWGLKFLDDETLLVVTTLPGRPPIHHCFRRRFPEWWWGHFYRPEVWFALALTVVLIWRGVQTKRATAR